MIQNDVMHDTFISAVINETISVIETHVPLLLQWLHDSLYTKENMDDWHIKILTTNDHDTLKKYGFHVKPQFVLYAPFEGSEENKGTYISCNKHALNNSSIMTFKMLCDYDKRKYEDNLIFCDMIYHNIDGVKRLNINTFIDHKNVMSLIYEVFVLDIIKKMCLLTKIVNKFNVNSKKKKD